MAKENEKPTAAEKGKGKATDASDGVNGVKEPEKDKDGKTVKDGLKADLPEGNAANTSRLLRRCSLLLGKVKDIARYANVLTCNRGA